MISLFLAVEYNWVRAVTGKTYQQLVLWLDLMSVDRRLLTLCVVRITTFEDFVDAIAL